MKRIAVASHVTLVNGKEYDGIGNTMIATLKKTSDDFVFVRQSMDGLLPSEVHRYKNAKKERAVKLHVFRAIAPLRYISEIINTTFYFLFREKVNIYIGIDPLNALTGILLKKLRRVDTAIFYTADYSESRFNNKVLDKVYHSIDRYCIKHADEVWSVSSRIVSIRKTMGLPDKRNIFIPNVPPVEYSSFAVNRHDKSMLLTSGIIDKQLDFNGVIDALVLLKDEYPDLRFTIIGNGPEEENVRQYAKECGVEDKVILTGRQPLETTLEMTSKAGIGLALYTGVWGFNKYGDSTKCREFFTYGLPVISTDTHSTVEDIKEYKAGIVVEKSSDAYVRAIRSILKQYGTYSKRSTELGYQYEGAHSKAIHRLL